MVRIRSDFLGASLMVAVLGTMPVSTALALEVFACEPEWGALVRVLAPDARVTSATHARQDPHHIEARPALIGALRRADLAVCTGASLEAGWLPALRQRAGNATVQIGRPGMFFAADMVTLDDRLASVDPGMGDVHAEGNPHFHLDPQRLRTVANRLAQRLAEIDPENAQSYNDRLDKWDAQWTRRIDGWRRAAEPLRDRPVIAQHSSFAYLFRWIGMRQTADLEPRPGLPPTIAHLQSLLQHAEREPPIAVVQSLYQDPQAGRWISSRIAVPILILPSTVVIDGPASTLDGLIEQLIVALLGALPKPDR